MSSSPLNLSQVRRAALRLEMADGRVNSITSGGADAAMLDQAVFDRDSERNAFHLAVREATGMDPAALARLLAI